MTAPINKNLAELTQKDKRSSKGLQLAQQNFL